MKKLILSFLVVLMLACSLCGMGLFQASANTETFIDELELDFSSDTSDFQPAFPSSAGWSAQDGVFKANSGWAVTAIDKPISTTGTKYITLDFNLGSDNNADQQFLVGFIKDKANPTPNVDLCANFFYRANMVQAYNTFSTLNWKSDYTKNFYDGQTHSMQIQIVDGVVSYSIDWEPVFIDVTLDSLASQEKMYFALQASDTLKYVDNLKISNTAPVMPNDLFIDELELDFSSEVSQNDFQWVLGNNGWSAKDGVFTANAAWAVTAVNKPISTTGEKYISFLFNLGDNTEDVNQQFLVGFLKEKAGFSADYDFSLNFLPAHVGYFNAFSKDDSRKPGFYEKSYYDGKDHAMLIRIKDGVVKFEIDGNEVLSQFTFNSLAGQQKMYFALQSTDTVKYIKNFKLFNTAPTEPYLPPVDPPDSSLDKSYVEPTKAVVDTAIVSEVDYKTTWIILSGVFGGLTLVSVAGLIFVLIKKRR